MRGEISSGEFEKRHPYDWYVEEEWVTEQLIRCLGFKAELGGHLSIWDPAAGYGTIGAAFAGWGFDGRIWLSDIVNNVDLTKFVEPPRVFSADFMEALQAPAPCSIVCNPPYSYKKADGVLISEAFARRALQLTSRRVCMLLPSKWLASQGRYRLFMADHPPAAVLHLCQRPSMPPGDRIAAMGNRAFRGGMVDYCWIVWDVTLDVKPGDTRTIWLPPLGEPVMRVELA